MILYLLFVLAGLCVPVAYAMGQITGSEAMRNSIMHHPSSRRPKVKNQFRQAA